MKFIDSSDEIRRSIENNEMLLIYFGSNNCNVCVSIKPKIEELLKKYKNIKGVQVDVDKSVEISGQYSIFTIPAILVFINGKETIREARFIGIENLSNKIFRYYDLLFED